MALERHVFEVTFLLASVASLPVSYGLFRMIWAVRLHPKLSRQDTSGRIYRLSENQRRDRLGKTFAGLCLVLAWVATLLIIWLWNADLIVRAFSGLGYLLIIWGCVALFRWRLDRDRAKGFILDAEIVTVLLPHGEERLLKSQIAGLQLGGGTKVAIKGSGLPWLQQAGQLVLKSSDPKAADLTLPPQLVVDAAFDEWAGSLPALGSPLLKRHGDLTVRGAGVFATVRSAWAEDGYTCLGLVVVFLLTLCLQMLFTQERALGGWSFVDAALLALGAARADLVFEKGEWFRLISAAFLHRDSTHFTRCAPLLAIMGMHLERGAGSVTFVAVILFSAAASAMASLYLAPEFVTVGASGAMFGVFGFSLIPILRHQTASISPWLLFAMGLGVLAAALPPGQLPYLSHSYFGPDHGGNLAGLITGLIAGLLVAMIPRRPRRMVAS